MQIFSRRRIAYDEPTDAVGNSGRTKNIILRGQLHHVGVKASVKTHC